MLFQHKDGFCNNVEIYKDFIQRSEKTSNRFSIWLEKGQRSLCRCSLSPRQTHFPQPWRKLRLDTFYRTYVTSHTPPWPRATTAGFPWSAFPCSPSPPLHISLSLCLSASLPIRIQCSNRSSKRWQKRDSLDLHRLQMAREGKDAFILRYRWESS